MTSSQSANKIASSTVSELLATFSNIDWRKQSRDRVVTSICFDSRKIEKDCIFVAIRGAKADGHQFLAQASEAAAVVVEDAGQVPSDFQGAIVKVESTRDALNQLSARFYGMPSNELFTIGVTGTNGKTTVTHMIESILDQNGIATGVIGTINHHLRDRVWPTELTTPDPISFQLRLREFIQGGAKAVAMEVSSIGLRQSRADEVNFDVAVFTNLSRDHLDYHTDMEDYFDAKKKLFTELLGKSKKPSPIAVINADDEYGKRLVKESKGTVWGYGANAEIRYKILEQGFFGTRFQLETPRGSKEFMIQMSGLHNVYNAMAAVGAALAAGVSLDGCAKSLASLPGVKGRLESVPNSKGIYVFVDYAHTDGAIETVLKYLGNIRTEVGLKNKIITVFGCGGDRDKGKRPLMMKAAEAGSDLVVLTSDNPRTEDPKQILLDALAGAKHKDKVVMEVDRREGIRKATALANPGDVILIAGKGHEDYQQIGTVKYPFSDFDVVREILK